MSLSINNYYNKKYYENYGLTSGNTTAARTRSSSIGEVKGTGRTDAADFNEIAKLFFNLDGTDETGGEDFTNNYSPASLGSIQSSLYGGGDMKAQLAQIQMGLGSTGMDSTALAATDESGSSLSSLQNLLGSNGLSYLSGDALSSLLQSVSSDSSVAGYNGVNTLNRANASTGIPAMLQAMGGFTPAFAWGLNSLDNSDSSDHADNMARTNGLSGLTSLEAGLTSEDMKSVLAHLKSSLESAASNRSTSAGKSNPLATVQTMLSPVNFSKVTNSELSNLFGKVLGTLA
ncbi:hypothetical protein [Paenibacillus sp. P32E]|uniref:hypothetical protein n=1 Tax=Paenibacillus sp. P32E TaxID=1349434 RepID=UPI00093FBB35|nr:hypothetical protein [Paenibacillus sp. P32E]OKP88740.1 hypothetical protein A3848_17400 [Paenibacillus sp. P32E]